MKYNAIKYFRFLIGLILFTIGSTHLIAQTKTKKRPSNQAITKKIKHKKELVYLYAANGGLVGYFSDGSVVGCPRCDFCRSNILAMFKDKPMGKWDLKKPDDFVSYEEDNGWVLINYKWKEKVPQF